MLQLKSGHCKRLVKNLNEFDWLAMLQSGVLNDSNPYHFKSVLTIKWLSICRRCLA